MPYGGSRASARLRGAPVIVEVSLALVPLAGAGLMVLLFHVAPADQTTFAVAATVITAVEVVAYLQGDA